MPTVQDILARKRSEVVSLPPDATVLAAARLMNERGIGGVVVIDQGRIAGIFTERDVMRRVVAERRDPAATPVRDVMTSPVASCRPDTPLAECTGQMTSRRIRHLPVIGDGELVGIVTIGDLMAFQVAEQADTIQYLNSYVFDVR